MNTTEWFSHKVQEPQLQLAKHEDAEYCTGEALALPLVPQVKGHKENLQADGDMDHWYVVLGQFKLRKSK